MAHLGILSLDTAFPRIVGDAGNPESYPFDAIVQVVAHADAARIVSDDPPSEEMQAAFVEAAMSLEAGGAGAIVSTCGFLIHAQDRVARAVRVPVMLSALSMYPMVQAICPGPIGILTASAPSLGPNALSVAGAGAAEIAGMDHHPLFRQTFLATKDAQNQVFDAAVMEQLAVQEAQALAARAPISALIIECGNLPPYAPALRAALGVPVFTILDAAAWMMNS